MVESSALDFIVCSAYMLLMLWVNLAQLDRQRRIRAGWAKYCARVCSRTVKSDVLLYPFYVLGPWTTASWLPFQESRDLA